MVISNTMVKDGFEIWPWLQSSRSFNIWPSLPSNSLTNRDNWEIIFSFCWYIAMLYLLSLLYIIKYLTLGVKKVKLSKFMYFASNISVKNNHFRFFISLIIVNLTVRYFPFLRLIKNNWPSGRKRSKADDLEIKLNVNWACDPSNKRSWWALYKNILLTFKF